MTSDESQIAEERVQQAKAKMLPTLDLRGLGLSSVPEGAGSLEQLRTLDVSQNELISVPTALGSLPNLVVFNADDNLIGDVNFADIAAIESLTDLSLERNCLKEFPESVCKLQALEQLHLDGNAIAAVPDEIASLVDLRVLSLASNKIELLPEALGSLSQLEEINLADNLLTDLPHSFGAELESLVALNLFGNPIRKNSSVVKRLTKRPLRMFGL